MRKEYNIMMSQKVNYKINIQTKNLEFKNI